MFEDFDTLAELGPDEAEAENYADDVDAQTEFREWASQYLSM